MSKPSLLHVIKSVLAAGIGVQSEKNRAIDFTQGSLPTYLLVGAVATVVFVAVIVGVVSLVVA
jgi:hypothetical protein